MLISLPLAIYNQFQPQAPAGFSIGWEGDVAGTYFTDPVTLAALPPALSSAINAALAAQLGGVITVPAPLDPTETALNDALARITALEAAVGATPPPVDLGPLLARLSALEATSHVIFDPSALELSLQVLARRITRLERRKDDDGEKDPAKRRRAERRKKDRGNG